MPVNHATSIHALITGEDEAEGDGLPLGTLVWENYAHHTAVKAISFSIIALFGFCVHQVITKGTQPYSWRKCCARGLGGCQKPSIRSFVTPIKRLYSGRPPFVSVIYQSETNTLNL